MAKLFLDNGVVICFLSGFVNTGGESTLLASSWDCSWPFFVCSGKAGCQCAVLKSHFHLHSGQYLPHFGLCSTQCKWFLRATLAAKKSDIVFNFWHCHLLTCRHSCSRPPGLDISGQSRRSLRFLTGLPVIHATQDLIWGSQAEMWLLSAKGISAVISRLFWRKVRTEVYSLRN